MVVRLARTFLSASAVFRCWPQNAFGSIWTVLLLQTVFLLTPQVASGLPLSMLYPFNRTAGDSDTEKSDDGGSGKVSLTQPFPFFGRRHDKLYVNNNGLISFVSELRTYRPSDFPLRDPTPVIAPFWADVDIDKVGGRVWYRETNDSQVLTRAVDDVTKLGAGLWTFRPTTAFVATWDHVGFYGAANEGKEKRNTFQVVLVHDWNMSFAIFIYHEIEWTTGSNSHGTPESGLGGNPAQAGFNAGDGVNYYELEGARRNSVINLTMASNVCLPGKWIFRVDSPDFNYANACPVGHQLGVCGEGGYCTPCPVGFYQDMVNQTECKQCPAGTSTSSRGSDHLLDCQDTDTKSTEPVSLSRIFWAVIGVGIGLAVVAFLLCIHCIASVVRTSTKENPIKAYKTMRKESPMAH